MLLITVSKYWRYREVHQSKMHPYRGREWWPATQEQSDYALGFEPPNYPVPAIVTRVQWDDDGPFVVEYHGPDYPWYHN